MIVHGIEVYRTYLAFKQHFSNENFDFFKYEGKVKAKEETYQGRRDFWKFEYLGRKYTDTEIKERFLSVFVYSDNPTKVWVGEVLKESNKDWIEYRKRWGSISYLFKEDIDYLKSKGDLNSILNISKGHPILLREYIKDKVMLETLLIFDIVCGFQKVWDSKLIDPVWRNLSTLLTNYKPFCSVNREVFKKIILNTF